MAVTILFEATPYNLTTSSNVTVRMSGANGDYRTVDINGYQWKPCVTGAPVCSVTIWDDGMVQDTATQWTELEFELSSEHGNTAWQNYRWGGQLGRIWFGQVGADFSTFTKVFEGQISDIRVDRNKAYVSLIGPEGILNNPLCDTVYTGTGGVNGHTDLQGRPKPLAFGNVQNIEPVQISTQYEVYQVHDGQVSSIPAVYENAMSLGASAGNYTTYAALTSATLALGQWATCHELGLFRLGAKPSGLITADCNGGYDAETGHVTTLATILPALMRRKGVLTSQINQTAFDAFSSYTWNLYVKEETLTVGDIVRGALSSVGGYLLTTASGGFSCGNYLGSSTPTALNEDRSTAPLVNSILRETAAEPTYRLKLGSNRCWRVHSKEEISDALVSAADNAAAAIAAAEAAQDAAEQAAADAATAMTNINAIVTDTILDRSEKAMIVREYGRIVAEKTGINSTATALNLTTENTAYNTAYNALTTYLLSTLNPPYNDLTANTTIVPATFNSKFNDYYGARQDILNKAAQLAAIVGYVSNPSIIVPASSTGVVSSWANANGRFIVMQGNTDVSEQCTFSMISISGGTGLVQTISNGAGSRGLYTISGGWTENTPAQIKYRAVFGTVNIDLIVTVAKAMAGATGSNGAAGAAGQDAKVGFLTNESHVVQTDSAGNGGSYVSAGGTFKVFSGASDITGTAGVTYTVQSATAGLTINIGSDGIYGVSGMTVDQATATLRAVVTTVTPNITIDKIYSISKSKSGSAGSAGLNATGLIIISSRQVISLDKDLQLTPALQPIDLQAFKSNTTQAVNWKVYDMNGVERIGYLSATTGDTVSMTAANFQTARNGTQGVIIEGKLADNSLMDKISVLYVAAGQTGAQGPTGPTGPTGAAGRSAIVAYSTSSAPPSTPITGDTWYQSDTQKWLRYDGTAWQVMLGDLAQYDQLTAANVAAGLIAADAIGANEINVANLQALSQTVGLLRTATSGARLEIESNQIRVYDAANALRARFGIW